MPRHLELKVLMNLEFKGMFKMCSLVHSITSLYLSKFRLNLVSYYCTGSKGGNGHGSRYFKGWSKT